MIEPAYRAQVELLLRVLPYVAKEQQKMGSGLAFCKRQNLRMESLESGLASYTHQNGQC